MDLITPLVRMILHYRVRAIRRYDTEYEKLQRSTLRMLVRNGVATDWGKRHGFDEIKSYSDFAAKVPVNDYASLRDDIHRMMEGEKSVLWPGRIKYFATSSGTTSDNIKFIPVSGRGLKKCHIRGGRDVTATYLDTYRNSHISKGYSLILSGNFNPKYTTRKAKVGDVSAIMMASIPPFFRSILHITPPVRTSQIKDIYEKYDTIGNIIANKNLVSFSGTPDWNLVLIKRTMEKAGVTTAEELWPNMELFPHGGMSFLPYEPIYDNLFPSGKIQYIETYNASEGFFGVQTDYDDPAMTLMLDYDIFYEFIPMSSYGKPNAKPIPLWETKPGVEYALIISTSCGLWRYDIGDVIKFTQKAPYKFVIVGRTHQYINIWGEDLSMQQAEKALADTCAETDASVLEFTVAPFIDETTGGGYHQWLIEFDRRPASLAEFAEILEQRLREDDHDYEHFSVASGGIMEPLEIIEARPGLFYDWMHSKGKMGGQHKVPRLYNGRKHMDELLKINHR
ncbi:MAG: GH3 auxin-responsive promoter family protein [Bacteroidales bacterium]|nr:GH3 auxin-responsive promoter family protein [Bacteroidales bacterium]